MDTIRLFLECNKIFFEVFSYVVVGIAGIIFSRYQYKSNRRQVEMQNIQIEMQRKESQPIFKILFHIDSQDEGNDTEIMEIYNEGKPFTLLNKYEIKTFYELQYFSPDNTINSSYYVPISGFYYIGKQTQNLTGKLLTKYLPGNHAKFIELYRKTIELSKNSDYIFIYKFSLIRLEYTDVYNNQQTVYFKDEIQINSELYNEIVNKSKEIFEFPFAVETVQLEEIKTHIQSLKLPVF